MFDVLDNMFRIFCSSLIAGTDLIHSYSLCIVMDEYLGIDTFKYHNPDSSFLC